MTTSASLRSRSDRRRCVSSVRLRVRRAFAACARRCAAQMAGAPAAGYKREPGMPASAMPAPLREIGFDQNLDGSVPLDIAVPRRSRAAPCASATTSAQRPVVLVVRVLRAARCSARRCSTAWRARSTSLSLDAGKDFDVVTVSFDPRDTPALAAAKKATYLAALQAARRRGRLALPDRRRSRRSIALTKAAGFRYVWDDGPKQFAHPTGIIVLTPDGRLARYLFGIEYGPRDLRLALVEASAGKVGTPVDALLLYCYHYDPMTGRYGLAIMRDDPPRRRRDGARARRRSSSSWCAASAAPRRTAAPGAEHGRDSHVVRHSAVSRAGLDDGRAASTRCTSSCSRSRRSSRC